MKSEPKPEKEIHVEKESPVKDSDPNHDSSQPSQVPSADHDSGTSATGSDATDAQPVSRKVHWSPELVSECPAQPPNPYVVSDPAGNNAKISVKDSIDTVKNVLGRWRRKVAEKSKKAGDLAGNTWQHLKTSPSFTDAALGRIAQGTKILAEGGYEKVFRQTFETAPEEQLQNSYACYLSTSAGPVMGIIYLSTEKLAYCSDSPLSYKSDGQTEWSYYKIVIPLHQLKAVNPSSSTANPSEKYIQVISVDNHEFWFMGFLNYVGAVECLQEALRSQTV